MPKHVVKDRTGRGVRWTLEVSADVKKDAARAAKAGGTAGKRTPTPRGTRASAKKAVGTRTASAKRADSRDDHGKPRRKRRHESQPSHAGAPAAVTASRPQTAEESVRAVETAPVAALARTHSPAPTPTSPRMIAIAVGAVLVVGALILARDPARQLSPRLNAQPSTGFTAALPGDADMSLLPTERMTRHAEPDLSRAAVAPAPKARAVDSHVADAAVVTKTAGRDRPTTTVPTTSVSPAAVTAPASTVAAPPREPEAKPTPVAATLSASTASPNAASDHAAEAPVSLTGCLEAATDGDRFRLTDVEGADVPKARGWRSGFLKKRPAPVDLVSPPVALAHKYVGYRVVATGSLESRELRVRSLQSMGSMCD